MKYYIYFTDSKGKEHGIKTAATKREADLIVAIRNMNAMGGFYAHVFA